MTTVGEGKYTYEVDRDWLRHKPAFWELGQCADVGVDSQDRVWLFSRSKHPVTCWTADGKFIGSWGDHGNEPGEFRVPHGVYIDSEDNIWLADHQTHQVTKHNENGDVLMELGVHGYANITVTTTNEQGPPFNMPTGLARSSDGKLFVSDGYATVVSTDSALTVSWNTRGARQEQVQVSFRYCTRLASTRTIASTFATEKTTESRYSMLTEISSRSGMTW